MIYDFGIGYTCPAKENHQFLSDVTILVNISSSTLLGHIALCGGPIDQYVILLVSILLWILYVL